MKALNYKRVLVCGDRRFKDRDTIKSWIQRIEPPPEVIIHGGAEGADSLAASIAEELGIRVEEYRADWKTHGKSAGPIRNQRMLVEGDPDLVLAFPFFDSRGTADMISRAATWQWTHVIAIYTELEPPGERTEAH